jgi:predicted ABC-type ATPase
MPDKKRIIIIAGPNGTGKTTFAREYLMKEAHCPDVVRRRFDAGLRNFQDVYKHLVDKWEWYDNSGNTPQLISEAGNWR